MGSFRRTLDQAEAIVRACIDCERYPKSEVGAGDLVADCSKSYIGLLDADPIGTAGACRVYTLAVVVALVFVCTDEGGALCVVDDGESLACCLDAQAQISDEQVVAQRPFVKSIDYGRPQGGAFTVKIRGAIEGVVCCGD